MTKPVRYFGWEMVINEPREFKVRKQVTRNGKKVIEWVDMRKGVAYLFPLSRCVVGSQ